MSILLKNLSKETTDLIYDKQLILKKEKLRHVSLSQTVETLLKEAYLRKPVKTGEKSNEQTVRSL